MAVSHFRNTTWGMSKDEVRATEPIALTTDESDRLVLDSSLIGVPCFVFYTFIGDRLSEGTYFIDLRSDVEDVDTFFRLSRMLTEKYGEPHTQSDWRDPFRSYPIETVGQMAKAVATGELGLRKWWDTESTRIGLFCMEDLEQFNAIVLLRYWDRARFGEPTGHSSDMDLL